ncbi:MAG: glycosyltransferase family A protein [Acidobacteriota bacterium]
MTSPRHRVVVPVHIPEFTGYYAQLASVLELCLDSIFFTQVEGQRLTVIANECAPEVVTALTNRLEDGKIDQLVVYGKNRGKVDALLAILPRCQEDIVTLSDGDVLLRAGWQAAVERVFQAFPECGWVAPVTALLPRYHTTSTLAAAGLGGELTYRGAVSRADLLEFAQSVDDPGRFSEEQLRRQLIVARDDRRALVGGGHFVASLRREAAAVLPTTPTGIAVSGGSEAAGLDRPIDAAGFWRLSTTRSYALHMGNVIEPRFATEFEELKANPLRGGTGERPSLPAVDKHWSSSLPMRARSLLARGTYRRLVRSETS